jgi:LEA14-like dessication related protein
MNKYLFTLLSLIFFLTACSDPKSFEFKGLKSVKIEKASLGKNIFNAQFEYNNPNHFELTLKKIDCEIWINDQKLTRYALDTSLLIPSNASFVVPAKMEIELSSLLKHSVDIMFNKPLKIAVIGNATLSKGFFTKTIPVNFSTMQKLNLKESVVRDAIKSIQN